MLLLLCSVGLFCFQLLSALDHNDAERIAALISSGTPVHDLAAHRSHTPLQHALALPSPYPLHALLSAFFASSSPCHLQERQLVLDTLVSQLHPSFSPSSAEHKQDSRSPFPASPALSDDGEDVVVRVRRALAAIRRGEFVVVVDGADRENEGDLIMDAALATAERIAYLVNESSGLICVGLSAKRAASLSLPPMVERNTESHGTAFTVSVDCNVGTSSGISAADRAVTIRALADDASLPSSFNRPGHVFPLIAKDGGVLQRPGHTEASVELSRLSGGQGVGVMCEIVRRDGAMMRPAELRDWSRRQGWEIISIADIIAFRKTTEAQPAQE